MKTENISSLYLKICLVYLYFLLYIPKKLINYYSRKKHGSHDGVGGFISNMKFGFQLNAYSLLRIITYKKCVIKMNIFTILLTKK